MGFTYPAKFTYLNTFVMQVAQRCSDNRGPTELSFHLILTSVKHMGDLHYGSLSSLLF